MRWFTVFAALLISVHAAGAEQKSVAESLKGWMPSLPDMPSLSDARAWVNT
jgi:hypothetical protein